jgi:hypothetical protein
MSIPRIIRLLFGFAFLAAGLCLPFAARSRSPDWNPQRTAIQNALASHVQLAPDTRKPRFSVVPKGEESPSAHSIQFEETQLFLEFDSTRTITEIQQAIKTHFPDNHIPPGDPVAGHLRFEGWSGHPSRSAPFGCALAASLGLLFAGGLLARASTIRVKARS